MDLFRHATKFEEHPAGTVFVREGEPGDRMYVVQEGQVEILHDGEVLERAGPGDFFGEMALVDDLPRSATVRAATNVRLVPITEREFLRLVELTPGFALQVMRAMARRLRRMLTRAPQS